MDVPTASVNAEGRIRVNPEFVEKLTVKQVVHLLCHEIGHVIMNHPGRLHGRHAKKWNIAGDAVINDLLVEGKVGEPISGGVYMPGSKDKSTDQVYNELPDPPDGDDGGAGGQGNGIGEDIDHSGNLSQSDIERITAETKVAIAQAAQAAKMQGKLSASLAKFAADLIEVHTPWYDILERHMTAFTRGDYSWARPNRRFIGQGVYLPTSGKVAQMGEVVVQVDVSGSISKQELDHYNGHLKRILEQCSPERVHVLYTDTEVKRHDTFEIGEEFALEFYSGGGTDMPAGFDYCAEKGITPEVFVCLTDGYTPWGEPPAFPVVWCVSSDKVADHGETIPFEIEHV